ncbi:MAG: hypothetical protein A2Y33_07925 [Spirochaetes bacterium GWF1_51_8]|nr:MAG: hypothetical protein A2Y33_07925 [Spirochaetes bacterium GWF1_51_8]
MGCEEIISLLHRGGGDTQEVLAPNEPRTAKVRGRNSRNTKRQGKIQIQKSPDTELAPSESESKGSPIQ